MPLSVYKAMMESRTPDDFLDLVLASVKNNRWQYSRRPNPDLLKRMQEAEDRYTGITFATPKGNLIYFAINRTQLKTPRVGPKNRLLDPRIRMFKFVDVPLDPQTWWDAEKIAGSLTSEHQFNDGKGSWLHQLKVPLCAVEHWQAYTQLKPADKRRNSADKAYANINVRIGEDKYWELKRYEDAAGGLSAYLSTLQYLNGSMPPDRYARHVGIQKTKNLGNRKPLDQAMRLYRHGLGFFKKMNEIATNKSEWDTYAQTPRIESAIIEHFRIEKSKYSRYLAEKAAKWLSEPKNRKAAELFANEIGRNAWQRTDRPARNPAENNIRERPRRL